MFGGLVCRICRRLNDELESMEFDIVSYIRKQLCLLLHDIMINVVMSAAIER